jgi:hypothetical protein
MANHREKNKIKSNAQLLSWAWIGGVFVLYMMQFESIARAVLEMLWPF